MISRREFIKIGAAGVIFGGATFQAAAQTVPQRRAIHSMALDDDDLAALREFVTMMKDPSRSGQPVSWEGFSNVHGTFATGFNLCPHGNWYFLPWHRSYIRMYEVAVRDLTGKTDFAMPYWDWTANPDFPEAFGADQVLGQPNPLFVSGRLMGTGDAMATGVTGQTVLDRILDAQTYEEFGSSRPNGQDSTADFWVQRRGTSAELEFNPHDNVHCDVRGPFMCTGASPQDPIFQMHHCNIDRIWQAWNDTGKANSADALWRDMAFTGHFIDPTGATYTDVVRDLLDIESLGYTYTPAPAEEPVPDDYGRYLYLASLYGATLPEPLRRPPTPTLASDRVVAPNDPLRIAIDLDPVVIERVSRPGVRASALEVGVQDRRVIAFLRGLEPDSPDETRLQVYVGEPGATDAPGYVTSIGFFGLGHAHGGMDMRPSVAVDVTDALRRLGLNGQLADGAPNIQIVTVPQGEGAEPASVRIGSVELAYV